MKKILSFLIFLIVSSCSGFLDQEKIDRDGIGINALALSDGSGYISTDEFNEITPFIFKNTNNGKKYLFFSSDRGGSYDIYYAEMDTDGKFSHPVKMDSNVNTTADQETAPVVFFEQYGSGLCISFSREITGEGFATLETYQLDADFHVTNDLGNPSSIGTNSRLSIFSDNGYDYLLVSSGYEYWSIFGWEVSWTSSGSQLPYPGSTTPVRSVCGYQTIDSLAEQSANWYLYTISVNGKSQICLGGVTNNYGHNFYTTDPFRSVYNDLDATLDLDDYKIYFVSDRYGKGNYDLYRYNLVRYDMVRAPFMIQPTITNSLVNSGVPAELYWETVPGASHYRILMSTNYGFTYETIGDVTGTSFVGTNNIIVGYYYYFKVEAVNDWGVADSYDVYVDLQV